MWKVFISWKENMMDSVKQNRLQLIKIDKLTKGHKGRLVFQCEANGLMKITYEWMNFDVWNSTNIFAELTISLLSNDLEYLIPNKLLFPKENSFLVAVALLYSV